MVVLSDTATNGRLAAPISERAKLEAASFSEFQQKNRLTEQTVQQWVCDVQQWAVTELVSTPGSTEDLRAEIESITVSLLRKKQDLYRQHDSNQTRQRKRKKIRDLKKKLREKILQYNSTEEDKIDEELACSLTEDYILPWERLEDGHSFRLKWSVFDQMMLLKRLEEEKSILVKEMSQHIKSLQKEMKGVEKCKKKTPELAILVTCRRRLQRVGKVSSCGDLLHWRGYVKKL
nr:uncharacterized protein LOC129416960 [Misgurnus anguillicaudatus]